MPDFLSLLVPVFFAGLITFLAPCTLPLVPGYLGFISGVSAKDIQNSNIQNVRRKVFMNGLMYVIGFSFVFVLLGILFGLAGSVFADYRIWLARIGGLFVIFFGLYLMHIFDFKFFNFLNSSHRFNIANKLTPGKPSSSLIFGMTFAFGWTPCIGPILGSVLLLASTSGTILEGGILLFVFSIGLGIPFLLLALFIGQATGYIRKLSKYLNIISFVGGLLLVFLGVLIFMDNFGIFVSSFYRLFESFNFEKTLINYL